MTPLACVLTAHVHLQASHAKRTCAYDALALIYQCWLLASGAPFSGQCYRELSAFVEALPTNVSSMVGGCQGFGMPGLGRTNGTPLPIKLLSPSRHCD